MPNWEWPEADRLEAKEKYREAYKYMASELKRDPDNFKIYIRLSFLCWYVYVEWGLLTDTDLFEEDLDECEYLLKNLTEYGMENYNQNPDFLWLFGYMVSLFPEAFTGVSDGLTAKYGIEMLEKALALRPEDSIIQLLLAEENNIESSKLRELQRRAAKLLPERFQGEGEMQRYFREVLDRL